MHRVDLVACLEGRPADGTALVLKVLKGLAQAVEPIVHQDRTDTEESLAFEQRQIEWVRGLARQQFSVDYGLLIADQFKQGAEDALVRLVHAWVEFHVYQATVFEDGYAVFDFRESRIKVAHEGGRGDVQSI